MDEMVMAGGKWNTENTSYYLYNGYLYWTMSPFSWNGAWACMTTANPKGNLFWVSTESAYVNVRPVINLKTDATFKTGGNGTQSNPYVVE